MSWPSITEWEMFITAQGYRLRNDLYCVEWDVKLYYISYLGQKSRYVLFALFTFVLIQKYVYVARFDLGLCLCLGVGHLAPLKSTVLYFVFLVVVLADAVVALVLVIVVVVVVIVTSGRQ